MQIEAYRIHIKCKGIPSSYTTTMKMRKELVLCISMHEDHSQRRNAL